MKDFFKSALKIAVAIVISVVALSVLGWLAWTANDKREQEAAKPFEVLKDWVIDLRSNLGMQLKAKTKIVNGRLYIAADFDGYPEYLSHPALAERNKDGLISLQFLDADGFVVFEKSTRVSDWSKAVDSNGKKSGLSAQFDEHISIDDYKRFAGVTVRWNLETAIPDPSPASITSNLDQADHCAPKITRAERLRRLAQHGSVRETGPNSYSAGNKSLTLFEDGSVLYCD